MLKCIPNITIMIGRKLFMKSAFRNIFVGEYLLQNQTIFKIKNITKSVYVPKCRHYTVFVFVDYGLRKVIG